MEKIPGDKIEHMLTEANMPKKVDDWGITDARNMMAYITYFEDGETEYTLIDKQPDGLGIHEKRAAIIINESGQVTDALFMHLHDGAIYDIGKDVPKPTDIIARNNKANDEDQFKWSSLKLLEVINTIPKDDFKVCPAKGHYTVTEGPFVRSPEEIRIIACSFLEEQIMSQSKLFNLSQAEMTMQMPSLSNSKPALANTPTL